MMMMIAILIAAIVVALVVFSLLCYKKAPPTQAIVVTGFGLSRPKVVCGRGVFVLPVVQRADRLNMRLLKIDVKTPETGVKTKEASPSGWTASSPCRSTARTPPSRTRKSVTPGTMTSKSTSTAASRPPSPTFWAWTKPTSMRRSTMCCKATCVRSSAR